jgi:DnaK suppressor protein
VVRPDRPASAKPAAGSAKSARKPDGKRAAVTSRKPLPAPAAPKAAAGQKTRPATVKAKPAPVKGKPAVRFSDADLLEFRNLLTKLRNDLVQKVAYLRDSSLRREDEVNHSEDGTDAFDRLFSLERAGGVQQRIYAIDEALREIDEGTYGICQSCESLIRKQRLLALPFARNCLDCQAAQERRRLGHAAAPAPRRFVP